MGLNSMSAQKQKKIGSGEQSAKQKFNKKMD
jgi:hypothetical protein